MNYFDYLSDISHGLLQFEEVPENQRATEESLIALERKILEQIQMNESVLSRSEIIAARSSGF